MTTKRKVSRNQKATEWTVMLRAVGTKITAVTMLYKAADMLMPKELEEHEDSPVIAAHNAAVIDMVIMLLGLVPADREVVDRVLRDLPEMDGEGR